MGFLAKMGATGVQIVAAPFIIFLSAAIDTLYDTAMGAGATGGKILGAGGGGFMLLFAPPEVQNAIREKVGSITYETWFTPLQISEKNPSLLIVETPDEFFMARSDFEKSGEYP